MEAPRGGRETVQPPSVHVGQEGSRPDPCVWRPAPEGWAEGLLKQNPAPQAEGERGIDCDS